MILDICDFNGIETKFVHKFSIDTDTLNYSHKSDLAKILFLLIKLQTSYKRVLVKISFWLHVTKKKKLKSLITYIVTVFRPLKTTLTEIKWPMLESIYSR